MKLKKLLTSPGLFFRDYLLKRYPLILNESNCMIEDEQAVIRNEMGLHALTDNPVSVDVVYTWVDGDDHEWKDRRKEARIACSRENLDNYADNEARFANHDELLYSIRSVKRYLPWVNHIYLVTDRQRPTWLEPDDVVTVIDHSQIIESEYLPTFNSHVIEACLHRIPGLSEQFIYFNDDVFVARPLHKSHFFRGNSIASIFPAQKSLQTMLARGVKTPTLGASLRSAKFLKALYHIEIDTPLVHTYFPLHKEMFELVWLRHGNEIRKFMQNRFRSEEDLNLASFLVPWTGYCEGRSVPSTDICYYFNMRSSAASQFWQMLETRKGITPPHSFCANDFSVKNASTGQDIIRERLQNYFNS